MAESRNSNREFEFALILTGPRELTQEIEDALFSAGCSDATLSLQHGYVYLEFVRDAATFEEAVFSAIENVREANIGAEVLRVDETELVTQAEIARRIGRQRQLVHNYILGKRGNGGFPAPECNLTDGAALWSWSAVCLWLAEQDMIDPDTLHHAQVVATINTHLDAARQKACNPHLAARAAKVAQTTRAKKPTRTRA